MAGQEEQTPQTPQSEVDADRAELDQRLAELEERNRKLAEDNKALRTNLGSLEAQATAARDEHFGFLEKMKSGKIKATVYRFNPMTGEAEYVKRGRLIWDVGREGKTEIQERLATIFGAGRYLLELEFPDTSGLEDATIEISITDSSTEAADKPAITAPVVPERKDSGAEDIVKTFTTTLENLNQRFVDQMAQIRQENAAQIKDIFTRIDAMRPASQSIDIEKLLGAFAQLATIMKPEIPRTQSPQESMSGSLSLLKDAITLGAELGSSGGVGGDEEEASPTLKLIEKLSPLLGPLLASLAPRPPTASPGAPQPQYRPAGRRVETSKPEIVQEAKTEEKPEVKEEQATPEQQQERAVKSARQLVEAIKTTEPDLCAKQIVAAVEQGRAPRELLAGLTLSPDAVIAQLKTFVPEIAGDADFQIRLNKISAALKQDSK